MLVESHNKKGSNDLNSNSLIKYFKKNLIYYPKYMSDYITDGYCGFVCVGISPLKFDNPSKIENMFHSVKNRLVKFKNKMNEIDDNYSFILDKIWEYYNTNDDAGYDDTGYEDESEYNIIVANLEPATTRDGYMHSKHFYTFIKNYFVSYGDDPSSKPEIKTNNKNINSDEILKGIKAKIRSMIKPSDEENRDQHPDIFSEAYNPLKFCPKSSSDYLISILKSNVETRHKFLSWYEGLIFELFTISVKMTLFEDNGYISNPKSVCGKFEYYNPYNENQFDKTLVLNNRVYKVQINNDNELVLDNINLCDVVGISNNGKVCENMSYQMSTNQNLEKSGELMFKCGSEIVKWVENYIKTRPESAYWSMGTSGELVKLICEKPKNEKKKPEYFIRLVNKY